MKSNCFLLIATILGFNLAAISQPGSLDQSFGIGGKVVENHGFSSIENIDVTMDSVGRILTLYTAQYDGLDKTVIIRYQPDGKTDSSFASNGVFVLFRNEFLPNSGTSIHAQADGKILVSGGFVNNGNHPYIMRLTAQGSIDSAFNETGLAIVNDPDVYAFGGFVITPDNKIVAVAAVSLDTLTNDIVLYKFKSSGIRDSSFGINGKKGADVVAYNKGVRIKNMTVQADGKLLIAGNYYGNYNGLEEDASYGNTIIIRLDTSGSKDIGFGTSGTLELDLDESGRHLFSNLIVQPDGRILISIHGENIHPQLFRYGSVVRLLQDGSFDNSFNSNGVKLILPALGYILAGRIALQADGKIIAAGTTNTFDNYEFAIARFDVNGMPDVNFDDDGFASIPISANADIGMTPFLQPDGKILVAGYSFNGEKDVATIVRLYGTGQPDSSFGIMAKTINNIGSGHHSDLPLSIFVQPDQKILNLRSYSTGISISLLLTRHLSNGKPDSSFGINGKTTCPMPVRFGNGYMARLNDGKILAVMGKSTIYDTTRTVLLKFDSRGFPDSSFGKNGRLSLSPVANTIDEIEAATIDTATGKVVMLMLSKELFPGIGRSSWIVRVNEDGSYDSSFNLNGRKQIINFTPWSISVQKDGKIICGGEVYVNFPVKTFAITRLDTAGNADVSFNNGNLVTTYIADFVEIHSLAVQSDNKIIATDRSRTMCRYNSNGLIDSSFGINGKVIFNETYAVLKTQMDGKFIAIGYAPDANGLNETSCLIKRYRNNGIPDSSFGINGSRIFKFIPKAVQYFSDIALMIDGAIVTAGPFVENAYLEKWYSNFGMARFNNTGRPSGRYTFTGNGNWNLSSNWLNNTMPPFPLPNGSEIIINPSSGSCILNVPYTVEAGGNITVSAGKDFVVLGNLTLQ
ncbi:MAG: hypothetical protein ABIX01_23935 [Chitinophagaceae bacterium]